jgi:hypothetical protein
MDSRRTLSVLALLGCYAGCVAVGAQEATYRVAGTMVVSAGRSLAVIERAAADAVLVGPGDELDGGRVIEIGERYVRLSFPDRDLLLPLTGGPAQIVPASAHTPPSALPHEAPPGTSPHEAFSRRVPSRQLAFAVDKLSAALEHDAAPVQRAGYAADAGRVIASLLDELIGFPAGSAVRTINGQSFSSVAQGLDLVQALAEQGLTVRFELDGPESGQPLYVFPD